MQVTPFRSNSATYLTFLYSFYRSAPLRCPLIRISVVRSKIHWNIFLPKKSTFFHILKRKCMSRLHDARKSCGLKIDRAEILRPASFKHDKWLPPIWDISSVIHSPASGRIFLLGALLTLPRAKTLWIHKYGLTTRQTLNLVLAQSLPCVKWIWKCAFMHDFYKISHMFFTCRFQLIKSFTLRQVAAVPAAPSEHKASTVKENPARPGLVIVYEMECLFARILNNPIRAIQPWES